MVVDAIDELQRANRRGAVEAAGVHDFEAQRGRGQIHPFQIAQPLIKAAGWRFLDGQRIHGFHRQRGLLLLFADALPHHFRSLNQHLVRHQFDVDALVGLCDLDLFQGVADERHIQRHWQRRHCHTEATVEIGHHALRGAIDHDACGKHGLSGVSIFDKTDDRGLG